MEIVYKKFENDLFVLISIGQEINPLDGLVHGDVEFDINNQAVFIDLLNEVIEDNSFYIVVDLTNVSYIDSSGLWALFEGHKKATVQNGHLVLLNPSKDVKRVLDITKVSSKIQIFVDFDEVVSFFKSLKS